MRPVSADGRIGGWAVGRAGEAACAAESRTAALSAGGRGAGFGGQIMSGTNHTSSARTIASTRRRSISQLPRSRHRIISARMKGVALENASHAEPAAFQRAVARDGFIGIARTRRLEATLREHEMRQRQLIAPNQCHYGKTGQSLQRHVRVSTASVNSARSTANEAV